MTGDNTAVLCAVGSGLLIVGGLHAVVYIQRLRQRLDAAQRGCYIARDWFRIAYFEKDFYDRQHALRRADHLLREQIVECDTRYPADPRLDSEPIGTPDNPGRN